VILVYGQVAATSSPRDIPVEDSSVVILDSVVTICAPGHQPPSDRLPNWADKGELALDFDSVTQCGCHLLMQPTSKGPHNAAQGMNERLWPM
jgi:hypothetical protein